MQLTILGTGSSGNCAVVTTDSTTLLVDVGLSARQTVEGLDLLGLKLDDLDGILLTHEHQDHIRGLEGLSRCGALSLFCTGPTQEYLLRNLHFRTPPAWNLIQTGSIIEYRDAQIENSPVTHDAVDPVGYVLTSAKARLGILTDLGTITESIRDRLRGSTALFVEANYDPQLLEADTKRPWTTKQRIASHYGHLSNDQAAELVGEIAHSGLKTVVLAHLSEDCNSPELAVSRMRCTLEASDAQDVRIICAKRYKPKLKIEV